MSENSAAEPAPESGENNQLLKNMERDLARGLQFSNLVGSLNQQQIKDQAALLNALVELLIGKGVIHMHELEERKLSIAESMEESSTEQPVVQLVETPDKYTQELMASSDCQNRWPVCKAVCCRLWFVISVQDLSEGMVRWNYGMPYGIAQGEDGLCVHLDRVHHRCSIYEHRPLICRTYDCKTDNRVWKDYEQQILSDESLAVLEKMAK